MTDLFEEKAQDWDSRPIPLQISEGVVAAIRRSVPLTPAHRVLDFGAGTGLLCGKLAADVQRILAVDVSPSMLARLAEKTELAGVVTPICQNILEQPLDTTVDLVVSAMALHHVEDTAALLAALYAHLEPGGSVALADLDSEPGTFHPPGIEGVFHHGFARPWLREQLQAAGFEDIVFETACTVDRDSRRYPVFLVTAQKARADA